MGEDQERLLDITSHDVEVEEVQDTNGQLVSSSESLGYSLKHRDWWLQVALFTLCTLAGQAGATLLGKVYYDQGGNSKWLVAALQTAGFPFLIPFLLLPSSKNDDQEINTNTNPPSILLLSLVYTVLGVILAAGGILYSVAIDYLPASTYTIVNSSQLAFNALFSFFLNAQIFTPYIINSVILLTFAPMLLVFGKEDDNVESTSEDNYIFGVLFTLGASACPALLFSLTQLAFEKIIKRENLRELLNMTILQSFVATLATLLGLFVSGEWKSLNRDMEDYKQGILSYFVNVVGTAIACQAYNFGAIALTFKVSSLFSNVVIRLGTPIVPFLSVVFLHEKMSGLKVMALWLALWGFASYIYQHYLDDLKANNAKAEQSSRENLKAL